ncbi:unnamed protein product, partial [Callosobruchus maculatus]
FDVGSVQVYYERVKHIHILLDTTWKINTPVAHSIGTYYKVEFNMIKIYALLSMLAVYLSVAANLYF